MGERKYTLSEIDRMRSAIETKFLFGYWPHEISDMPNTGFTGRPYQANEKVIAVEEMLRTHMIAGTDPNEMDGR